VSAQPTFIPARDPTVDPTGVADLFSEALVNSYGRWYTDDTRIHVNLDGVHKVTRNYSIRAWRQGNTYSWFSKPEPAGTAGVFFAFNNPQDLTTLSKFSFAAMMYDRYNANTYTSVPILAGYSAAALGDKNGIVVYTSVFSHLTNQETAFSAYEFSKSELSGSSSFDWTNVKYIGFYIGLLPFKPNDYGIPRLLPAGYDIWIDSGPFLLLTGEAPMLKIQCQDTSGNAVYNKTALITNNQNNSTNTYTLPIQSPASAGSYTIRVTDSDFVKWSDGITTASRDITLTANETLSLTAIYTGGSTTPDGGGAVDWTTIAIAGGAIGIAGLAAYYLLRRKKRSYYA
jgi:hypothetical protein